MKTAEIGDITVAYDDEGAGQALLLVHGHPFDRTMWRPQIERFGLRDHSGVARPTGARRAEGPPRNPRATAQWAEGPRATPEPPRSGAGESSRLTCADMAVRRSSPERRCSGPSPTTSHGSSITSTWTVP